MPHFKALSPHLMDLPEMEKELLYQQKRLYRLRKLEKLGKSVEPDLREVFEREQDLDIAVRERRLAMSEIPD